MLNSGIYQIINLVTNKSYIGSTKDFKGREWQHFNMLERNKHSSKKLQRSYNKHGKNNFKFEIIAKCPIEYLIKLEQYFLNTLKPQYNIYLTASNYEHQRGNQNLSKSISERHLFEKENKIKNKRYKLDIDTVKEIKKYIAYNWTMIEISEKFGFKPNTIQNIKSQRSWKNVPEYIIPDNEKHLVNPIVIQSRHLVKYSDELLLDCIKDYQKGMLIKDIRTKYNVGKQIENILYKKSRTYLWDKINQN